MVSIYTLDRSCTTMSTTDCSIKNSDNLCIICTKQWTPLVRTLNTHTNLARFETTNLLQTAQSCCRIWGHWLTRWMANALTYNTNHHPLDIDRDQAISASLVMHFLVSFGSGVTVLYTHGLIIWLAFIEKISVCYHGKMVSLQFDSRVVDGFSNRHRRCWSGVSILYVDLRLWKWRRSFQQGG